LTAPALARLLPIAPRPHADERLTSWLAPLAALYGAPAGALFAYCGLAGVDPFALEKGLGAGEGAQLAERAGISLGDIEAMTFGDLAAPVHSLIARGDRATCPLCAKNPAIKRKDAALPWVFWRRIHGLRRRALAGAAIETLFGRGPWPSSIRSPGRARVAWPIGPRAGTTLAAFLATPHAGRRRRASASSRVSRSRHGASSGAMRSCSGTTTKKRLEGSRKPEEAGMSAKPVRPGLQAAATGSLLQRYALAVGVGRMILAPVESAAAPLAGDDEGA
jgi:TniQ